MFLGTYLCRLEVEPPALIGGIGSGPWGGGAGRMGNVVDCMPPPAMDPPIPSPAPPRLGDMERMPMPAGEAWATGPPVPPLPWFEPDEERPEEPRSCELCDRVPKNGRVGPSIADMGSVGSGLWGYRWSRGVFDRDEEEPLMYIGGGCGRDWLEWRAESEEPVSRDRCSSDGRAGER